MNQYDYGDKVRTTGTFTNAAGTAIDPAVVKFSVKPPSGTVTTYTYGVDSEVVKSATGIYYIDTDLNEVGNWAVRAWSTGTGQASDETYFSVASSEFD